MVQWFSPGFSACVHRFETRLMIGILLDAGVSWRVQVFSCASDRLDPVPDLNVVVFHRDSSSNMDFEIAGYIIFSIV